MGTAANPLASGASVNSDEISNAPQIVPLNTLPALPAIRKSRKVHNPNSAGIPWGNLPGQQDTSSCLPASPGGTAASSGASLLNQITAMIQQNPWAALFIAAGLGVIVVAMADSASTTKRNPAKRKAKK
jgi:hypothetical protein